MISRPWPKKMISAVAFPFLHSPKRQYFEDLFSDKILLKRKDSRGFFQTASSGAIAASLTQRIMSKFLMQFCLASPRSIHPCRPHRLSHPRKSCFFINFTKGEISRSTSKVPDPHNIIQNKTRRKSLSDFGRRVLLCRGGVH